MKLRHIALAALAAVATTAAAQQTGEYMFEREMPVFLDSMQAALTYPMAWGHSEIKDFNEWKTAARAKLREEMLMPPPPARSYNMEVEATERRKGYTARKLLFNLTAYSRVRAYELVPDGKGPHPAILLLHDHGGHFSIGKEKMVMPFGVSDEVMEDAMKWQDACYGGQFMGDYLARHGFVVLAVDAPFWGERGEKEGSKWDDYKYLAGNFMMMGRNLSAWMNFEDAYAADFLASLPEVDGDRIGATGHSMGGYRTWMLAAMTDRVKAAAPVCWMTTTKVQMSHQYGLKKHEEWANIIPGMRRYMDYPHIASLACPKPMLFINGDKDKLFPLPGVNAAFTELHRVWESQGADKNLTTIVLPMPHYCGPEVQKMLLSFFKKNL